MVMLEENVMYYRPYNILFICTSNSACSIFGESLINFWGQRKFRGFSAGSQPKGEVHPLTLQVLKHYNISTDGLRSKRWDEYAQLDAPKMDFVFTVCGKADAESCPVWPDRPMSAHWEIEDPAGTQGDDVTRMMAFRTAFRELENRIKIFVSLLLHALDRLKLQKKFQVNGQIKLQIPRAPNYSTLQIRPTGPYSKSLIF
jgi:protein-tyrosine-phosphatase